MLWNVLGAAYARLGFDDAVADEAFRAMVLARVIEPTSKADTVRGSSTRSARPLRP